MGSLSLEFDWILMSNGLNMLGFTDTRYIAFGPQVQTKGSLSFKFDWIKMSIGWNMRDFTDTRYFAMKLHGKVIVLALVLKFRLREA